MNPPNTNLSPLVTVPRTEFILDTDYPFKYLSYNTLERPSTFSNLCIEPNNCLDSIKLPAYVESYTKWQQDQLKTGEDRYIKSRQAVLSPYIGLYCSNMSLPIKGRTDFLS